MSTNSIVRVRTAEKLSRRRARFSRARARLGDGALTTVHVASYERAAFALRVAVLDRPEPLGRWCAQRGIRHAVVGGFFLRPSCTPLGELRIDGVPVASEPFHAPWAGVRACVHAHEGGVSIARRDGLAPEPPGDLLQAGPLLVRDGRLALHDAEDAEGFSAGCDQFDSDITRGRYPRAALGVNETRVLAVACDGRTDGDAGMTLEELANAMIELGAVDAINLDGGGSTSLIHNGRLRNRPREEHGVDLLGGRPIVTALVFQPHPG